ncbi:unnamed protein product [Effrenium voratum]|uniref:Uncharacterized protein n=1 Tax=Effrenium voratum TaxID=2562239 RepID=A0AA36I077_9DINO|nr:unnamed protein product [Effrenium voratum]CAJ1417029.1 unnamed protein product [Effrenium voratum]
MAPKAKTAAKAAPREAPRAAAAGSGADAARSLRTAKVCLEIEGMDWATKLGVPKSYESLGAEIAGEHRRAITLAQIQELASYVEELAALQVFDWEEVNLYTICKALVKPLTLRFRCSFVELVAAGPQEPLWFVSHWWGTPFRQTASLIAFHALERELSPAAAYWICTFANNQHDLSSLSGGLRSTPFVQAILSEGCVGTLALLDSQVTTFDRVWCVLENFVSTEWAREAKSHRYDIAAWLPANIALHGGQPVPEKPTLRLDLGDQVREAVEEESTGGAFPLLVAVKGVEVDIRKAKSSRPEDKQKILHLIAGTPEEAWSEAPPETCEAFDSMNARVRRMFAAGALYRAALQDDQKELKLLLDGFPDALNESISDGASAAYAAAMKNHVEALQLLVAARADVDHTKRDGASATFIAAQFGSGEALQLLLASRANPSVAREDGTSPLFMAVQNTDDSDKSGKGDRPILQLLEARAEVDALTGKGVSALHLALQKKHKGCVQLLLDAKADPNLPTADGHAPLDLATPALAKLLKDAGAEERKPEPKAKAKGKAKAKASFTSAAASLRGQIDVLGSYGDL